MSRRRRAAAALVATVLLAPAVASAEERPLVLEVIMNGRPTGRIGEFIDRDGALYARPADLSELGFALPQDVAAGIEPIPIASLANVRVQVDEAKQTLAVEASDVALRPTELGGANAARLAPLSPGGFGAVFNYDILSTFTGQESTGGALLDLRAFSPYGVLQSSSLANTAPMPGQPSLVRLDTVYTYSQPDELRRWRGGDVVTGALNWSRAVRLGGGQVSSDFGLRPDLVTYPLPVISAAAAVPSTVNVLVNGIRQFSGAVQPGPFALQTLPMVSGAGEVAVAMQDALGRQTLITLPFYASTALLKPGLASYSLEAGLVRQNYGLTSDRYSSLAANGSSRYGVTDWLTVETHGEATDSLVLLGGGAALLVGQLGIVNAAASGSSRLGGNSGGLIAAGFQRVSPSFNLSINGTLSTDGYSDIADANGSPVPKSTLNISLGRELGRWGNIGVAYLKQVPRAQQGPLLELSRDIAVTNPRVELVTASYGIPIAGLASLFVTVFKDLRDNSNYGCGIGISFALGGSTSGSVGAATENGHSTYTAGVAKNALRQNDYGYRLDDSEGALPHRIAEGEFLSPWGRATAGVDQTPSQSAGRAGARGAVVLAGGHLFASDQIADSFAVVHTGDVADVPVLYENRRIGVTDSEGQLLVPSLLSYQNNRLSVDSTRLPADIDVGQTAVMVRPPDRSGVVVDFHIRRVNAALLKLQDSDGQFLPLGSVAKVVGAEDKPVGYDGEAYVTGLKPTNRMEVVLLDGATCVVQFDYKPVTGDIPVIGPLVCR